jgi:hypothetical protein
MTNHDMIASAVKKYRGTIMSGLIFVLLAVIVPIPLSQRDLLFCLQIVQPSFVSDRAFRQH